MRSTADLYRQMADARAKLSVVVMECYRLHDGGRDGFSTDVCDCPGCVIRRRVEQALGELEV